MPVSWNGKNLETKEYDENLIRYLDNSESNNSLKMDDLNIVLEEVESTTLPEIYTTFHEPANWERGFSMNISNDKVEMSIGNSLVVREDHWFVWVAYSFHQWHW